MDIVIYVSVSRILFDCVSNSLEKLLHYLYFAVHIFVIFQNQYNENQINIVNYYNWKWMCPSEK